MVTWPHVSGGFLVHQSSLMRDIPLLTHQPIVHKVVQRPLLIEELLVVKEVDRGENSLEEALAVVLFDRLL